MKKRIFITGSSGLLGKSVLNQLDPDRFEVTIGSRRKVSENSGYNWQCFNLDDKEPQINLEGIDVVLHLASNTGDLGSNSDISGIKQLIEASARDEVGHFIYISIVGVDKVPVKYFKTKRKVEKLLENSSLDYSILRATQFHEFLEKEILKQIAKYIIVVPNIKYQPVETNVVAKKLIEMTLNSPSNSIVEIGGSETIYFKSAIQEYTEKRNKKPLLFAIPNMLLGKLSSALTTPNIANDSISWSEYLNRIMPV
jgi:uncharacterized protein YbjT (DUF2867 family)